MFVSGFVIANDDKYINKEIKPYIHRYITLTDWQMVQLMPT